MVGVNREVFCLWASKNREHCNQHHWWIILSLLMKFLGSRLQQLLGLTWIRKARSYQTKTIIDPHARWRDHGSPCCDRINLFTVEISQQPLLWKETRQDCRALCTSCRAMNLMSLQTGPKNKWASGSLVLTPSRSLTNSEPGVAATNNNLKLFFVFVFNKSVITMTVRLLIGQWFVYLAVCIISKWLKSQREFTFFPLH